MHLLKFGDLSGVVYCRNNKAYVGGNQRSKIFEGCKITIIERFDNKSDKTTAIGFIEWLSKNIDPKAEVIKGKTKIKYVYPLDRRFAAKLKLMSKPYPKK